MNSAKSMGVPGQDRRYRCPDTVALCAHLARQRGLTSCCSRWLRRNRSNCKRWSPGDRSWCKCAWQRATAWPWPTRCRPRASRQSSSYWTSRSRRLMRTLKPAQAALCAKAPLLEGFQGIGEGTKAVLMAAARVGTTQPTQIGKLVGVAPLNHDQRQMRGKRSVWGGRADGRSALAWALSAVR